jgi:D-serine dehydratase
MTDSPVAAPLTAHGASRLTPEEISVIELYFRRREQLDGHARVRASGQIAARIRERLDITARMDDDAQFLEEVTAEYRARGRFR